MEATTRTEEAARAELEAYLAWCDGTADNAAIEALERAIARIADRDERTRYRVALALARARADLFAGRDGAIDHIIAIHPETGGEASALSTPTRWAAISTFVLVGALLAFGGIAAGFGTGPMP